MPHPRWKCPLCQSADLSVIITTSVKLRQYGEDDNQTEDAGRAHEWDGCSLMTCEDCTHTDSSRHFDTAPD